MTVAKSKVTSMPSYKNMRVNSNQITSSARSPTIKLPNRNPFEVLLPATAPQRSNTAYQSAKKLNVPSRTSSFASKTTMPDSNHSRYASMKNKKSMLEQSID